jgi:carbon-monoxide dehydrogenase large subunit
MRYVGTSVQRTEDSRLLTGAGSYIADLEVPGLAHAAFLRSPMAHARIVSIDTTMARQHPGVRAVITGKEMAAFTNRLVGVTPIAGYYSPPHHPMATDRVRYVGDPVAIVVATSRYVAEDALPLIDVEYEPLPSVASIAEALDPISTPLWNKAKGNQIHSKAQRYGDTDRAFAKADRIITRTFVGHRVSNQPMETRGFVAERGTDGEFIFHSATQNTHGLRWTLGAITGRRPIRRSIRALAFSRRRQLRTFLGGAKDFLVANRKRLFDQDISGVIHQLRTDSSTLGELGRQYIGLIAKGWDGVSHVEAGDIGGAFGSKTVFWREEIAVAAAATELDLPIKWIEDRNENLASGGHARDEELRVEAAVNDDGEILALRVQMTMDQGAYPAVPFGAAMFTEIMRVMLPGLLKLSGYDYEGRIVTTNKGTYVAYRGPWAMETFARERMIDVVARELGLTREEVRRRNIFAPEDLPAAMITGPTLDESVSGRQTLDAALDIADLPAFRAEQERARAEGRAIGIGFATFHEAAPGPPGFREHSVKGSWMLTSEPARTSLDADGRVRVEIQQVPHGQGHETTIAQVAADQLDCSIDDVRVVVGNTRRTPTALIGTGGSRSAGLTGGAVTYATRDLRQQIVDRAADMLEASPTDITIVDGNVHVAGVPARGISFADIAADVEKAGGEPLRAAKSYDPEGGGWAVATHLCWVEVDLKTGFVHIPRYVVVEDCGAMINPAVVEGQVRGGVAQGIGAVLYEKIAYDSDANFQSGTFADYLVPTSMEIPEIEVVHLETPSDFEINYRGVGEGGMIGAPPAIVAAIEDAIGVEILEQHLPPTRILELAGVI